MSERDDDGDIVVFGPPIRSSTVRARIVDVRRGEPLIDPDEFADDIENARILADRAALRRENERLRADIAGVLDTAGVERLYVCWDGDAEEMSIERFVLWLATEAQRQGATLDADRPESNP